MNAIHITPWLPSDKQLILAEHFHSECSRMHEHKISRVEIFDLNDNSLPLPKIKYHKTLC